MKTLVIFSHPNYVNSTANKIIIDEFIKKGMLIRHLDKIYPGYNIDVNAEQKALLDADTIILQFPFYWYSCPPALKNWIDQVFSFNFAYGPEGDKLKGKNLLLSITVGGPENAYTPLGYNHFRIDELLKPFEQTAYLSQLNFLPPIYTNGLIYIPNVYNVKEEVEAQAKEHANRVFLSLEL